MSGSSQGMGNTGGVTGELDGQSLSFGTVPKDQRTNKEALIKMTRNKRQSVHKIANGQPTK